MRMQQNGILGGIPAPQATPQQQLGSMVGAPSARLGAPKSPQQVAAEQVVESDVPKELEALIKERKALELLASAQRDKQAQQPVQPQTVKSQVEGGLASMMDRLRPGMAQRGRQVQVARNRQAMGLPSMPAPNMARRMASGGVVGFQDRGFVDVDELAEEYNLTSEGVDRLLNLDELSEEPQEVEVEAPRERPRYRTPEERRVGSQLGDSLVEYVKENPLQAASIASMAIPGALALRGLGSLGVAGARRFGPAYSKVLNECWHLWLVNLKCLVMAAL